MPKRLLDSSLFASPSLAKISPRAQDAFPRFILVADDFGCFDANPRVLVGLAWSLRNDVTEADVEAWLHELEAVGMVQLWEQDGRRYCYLTGWTGPHGQRPREEYDRKKAPHGSKRKTPAPPRPQTSRAVPANSPRGKPPGDGPSHPGGLPAAAPRGPRVVPASAGAVAGAEPIAVRRRRGNGVVSEDELAVEAKILRSVGRRVASVEFIAEAIGKSVSEAKADVERLVRLGLLRRETIPGVASNLLQLTRKGERAWALADEHERTTGVGSPDVEAVLAAVPAAPASILEYELVEALGGDGDDKAAVAERHRQLKVLAGRGVVAELNRSDGRLAWQRVAGAGGAA